MQQFLLFCTMLMVASEAFSQELHGSRISRSIERSSRLANKLIPPNRGRYMFRRLSFSPFSPLPAYESPDYDEPFAVPPARGSRRKRRKNYSPRGLFTRRKHSRKRGCGPVDVTTPLEGFDPRRDLATFFPEVYDSRFTNQYMVYLYPVFIRPRKRRVDSKRRFSFLKRQYLNSLRNKSKRSAGNVSPEGMKNDGSVPNTAIEAPPLGVRPNGNAEARREPVDSYRYGDENYQRNNFDLYNPYLDMTQPVVTLPTVTFKYPYDRRLYEPSPRRGVKKGGSGEENCKRQVETGSHQDIGRLREMLQEVESMLGGESDVDKGEADEKSEEKEKKEESTEEAKVNETISLKEKIDCIAIPILNQISERLGKIAGNATGPSMCNASLSEYTKAKTKANYRCSPDGTWKSSALGIDLVFTTMPNLMLKVQISSNGSAVINRKWSIQGLTMSKRGGPLMLAAIYPQKRKMASFIGQCKTCQDQDLIFGSWTVYTCVRKFTELWSAVETKSDILKKVKKEPKDSSKKKTKKPH